MSKQERALFDVAAKSIAAAIDQGLVPLVHVARVRSAIRRRDLDAMAEALAWIGVRAALRARDWEALEKVLAGQGQ